MNRAPFGSQDRRQRKMAKIDNLPRDLRELVHDVGWNIVKEFVAAGIVEAKTIRRLTTIVRHETTMWKLSKEDI